MIKISIKQGGSVVEYQGISYRTPVNVFILDEDKEVFLAQLKQKMISEYDMISGIDESEVPNKSKYTGTPGSRRVKYNSLSNIKMSMKIGKK